MFQSRQMTFVAGATLAAYTRVKLNTSQQVVAAAATDRAIGYIDERGATSGSECCVNLIGYPFNAVAAGAVEIGDVCWAAAAGKVNDVDAGSALVVGIAYTAAAADNDPLTLLPCDYI